jgi:hypothetical protein
MIELVDLLLLGCFKVVAKGVLQLCSFLQAYRMTIDYPNHPDVKY